MVKLIVTDENLFFVCIQQKDDVLWGVTLWQIIARTMVKNVSKKKEFIRILFIITIKKLFQIIGTSVNVRCNHYFH